MANPLRCATLAFVNHLPRMYLPQDLPEAALTAAEEITLRDLLESPSHQAWLLSALGNAAKFSNDFKGAESHLDEYLQFKAHKVFAEVPYEQRMASFQATNTLIRNHKISSTNAHR